MTDQSPHQADHAQERGHILVIEPDAAYAARFPDAPVEYRWSIECQNPARCGGWQECHESHQIDGEPVNDGPWESEESAPWFEEDYYTFHGVEHEWRYGYGWTVPFDGCVVAENAGYTDCPVEPMRPGRWLVDDEWDDTYMSLNAVEELALSPVSGSRR